MKGAEREVSLAGAVGTAPAESTLAGLCLRDRTRSACPAL